MATASEGNHGRSVAWAARLLGVPAVIFLPEHAAPERVANIRREGADIVLVAGNYEDAVHRCDEESRRRGWQIVSDVGYDGYLEIPPLVVEGYSTLFGEIDHQLAEAGWPAPGAVAIPGGVGGVLQAGVDHYRARVPGPRVIGVEPREADCLTESLRSPDGQPTASRGSGRTGMACLNCREVSLPSWPAIRRGVDALVGIEERYAEEAVRLLYQAPRAESLEVGTSGAASVGGLLALMTDPACAEARSALGLGADTVALAVCTEGAIDRPAFERLTRAAG
ncbi:MAG: pyridoxal-phosphate dependent enzyme [Gemmatimonadales bacterium]